MCPRGRAGCLTAAASWPRGPPHASGSLWRVPATGGVPEQLGVGGDNASQPSISRRGNRLAFVQTQLDTDTWEIGVSGSPPKGQSPRKVISSSRSDDAPQLSPDGSKIAFESDRSGSAEIWICDRNGANALQLTRFGGQAGTPRWSPDGRSIAFDAEKGNGQLRHLRARGGRRCPAPPDPRGLRRRRAELVRRRPVGVLRLGPHGNSPGLEGARRRRPRHPGDEERRLRRLRVTGRQPALLREVRCARDLDPSGRRWRGAAGAATCPRPGIGAIGLSGVLASTSSIRRRSRVQPSSSSISRRAG